MKTSVWREARFLALYGRFALKNLVNRVSSRLSRKPRVTQKPKQNSTGEMVTYIDLEEVEFFETIMPDGFRLPRQATPKELRCNPECADSFSILLKGVKGSSWCFVFETEGGELAARLWMSVRQDRVRDMLEIRGSAHLIKGMSAYVYDGRTVDKFRGARGVLSRGYPTILREMKRRGIRSIIGGVDPGNKASLRANQRLGFRAFVPNGIIVPEETRRTVEEMIVGKMPKTRFPLARRKAS